MELNKTYPSLILISCPLAVLNVTNNNFKKTAVRQNEKLICIILALNGPKIIRERTGGAVILSLPCKSPHGSPVNVILRKTPQSFLPEPVQVAYSCKDALSFSGFISQFYYCSICLDSCEAPQI